MIFLKLPRIEGDSMLPDFDKWISLSNVTWSIEREFSDSSKQGAADVNLGAADLPPMECTKSMDYSSVNLMFYATCGRCLSADETAEMVFVSLEEEEGSAKPFINLQYKFQIPIISSWSITGSEDDRPEETFTLWYHKIWMQYHPHGESGRSGSIQKGWDRIMAKDWNQ